MADVERLLKGTVEELERLLNAKHVLAEPIEKGSTTVIPLVSYGFGFGCSSFGTTLVRRIMRPWAVRDSRSMRCDFD